MKKLLNKLTTTGVLLIACNATHAQVDVKREAQEKVIALNLVKEYAHATSCETSFDPIQKNSGIKKNTTIKDVFTIQAPEINGQPEDQSIYYVLWQGNKGCEFANAPVSEAYHVTEVIRSIVSLDKTKPLTVNVKGYFDEDGYLQLDDEFRFDKNDILNFTIQKVQKVTDSEYDIFSRGYDNDDISYAPSLNIQTRLKYDADKREWSRVFQKTLGKAD